MERFPDAWSDLRELYHIKDVVLDRLVMQELGEVMVSGSVANGKLKD